MAQWNKIITSGSDTELNSLSSSLLNVGTQGSSYSFPTSSGEVSQVLIMNDDNQLSFANTADNLPAGTLSSSQQIVDALDGQDLSLGVVSASILHEIYTTQSINLGSGSFQFGDTLDDTHTFTGSVNITGSLNLVGNLGIDGITDVSASIAALEDFSSSLDSTFATDSELQNLIDKTGSYATTGSNTFTGNQTINAATLEIDNADDAQIVLDRGANSNDAEIVFQTNNTLDWTIGTGQIGGDADFTIRHQNNNNIFRLSGTGLNINTPVSASEFTGSFNGIFNGAVSSSAQIASDISGALSNTAIAELGAGIISSSQDAFGRVSVGITGSLSVSQSVEIVGDITSVGKILQNREQRSTFIGFEAGENEDDGNRYNVGLGYRSLCNLNDGTRNVAIGFNAMEMLDGGDRNVGIGSWAGAGIVMGNENTYIGVCAGADMLGGNRSCNVGIGFRAAYQATAGNHNTSIGTLAGMGMTSGSGNVQIGWRAGNALTTGQYNIAIGTNSDWSNICGDCNVVIGYNARNGGTIDDHVIVIGANAVGRGEHTVTIGSSIISSSRLYGTLEIDGIADVSASIAALEAGDIVLPDGTVSSSAQLASNISGALSNTAITDLGAEILSSSNGLLDFSGSISASGDLHILGQLYGDGSQLTGVSASAIQNGLLFGNGLLGGTFTGILDVTSSIDTSSAHFITGSIEALENHAGLTLDGTITTANTASFVEYTNIYNLPTLISSSAQLASNISGAFDSVSASLASDIAEIPADFVAVTGDTMTGNLVLEDSELHVGDVSGDSWTRIKHEQGDGYGFDWTHDNATVIVNEQGTTIEALVLGDTNTSSTSEGLFGIAHSTDGTNWTKKLDLRGNGDLYIGSSGSTKVLTTSDGVVSGSAQVVDLLNGENVTLGRVNATEIVTEIVSSSISFSTGSNIFGDELSDNHEFTGSINVTGSITATSFTGDGSGLTGITADSVTFANVTNKPTLISSSNQLEGFVSQSSDFVANEFIVANGANSVTSSNLLSVDMTEQRIGIGTSTPEVKLDLVGETSGEAQVRIAQHDNSGDGPDMRFFKSRGTAASPLAVNNDDYVGAVNAFVYDGSNYQQGGFFGFQAEGTDGDTTFGIRTRVDGTLSDRIAIDAAGDVDISGSLTAQSATVDDFTINDTLTANTITGSLLRLSEGGSGLRLTNVGGFEPQSGTFNIFGNNDVTFGAGGSGASERVLTLVESNRHARFEVAVSASVFSGSFVGDGSELTGITADSVTFDNVTNKPTLFSSSAQLSGSDVNLDIISGSNLFVANTGSISWLNVIDQVQLNGPGSQYFAYNEDTVKVKFANWYNGNENQFGQTQLWNELAFIATNGTDHKRISFYLDVPDSGSTDSLSGVHGAHGNNYAGYFNASGFHVANDLFVTGSLRGDGSNLTFGGTGIISSSAQVTFDSASYAEIATTASFVAASAVTNVTTYRETVSGATSYTVTHNLNEEYPIVQAWNTSNNQMEIPASITSDSANQVTVDFGLTFAGQIVVKI